MQQSEPPLEQRSVTITAVWKQLEPGRAAESTWVGTTAPTTAWMGKGGAESTAAAEDAARASPGARRSQCGREVTPGV